MTEIRPNTANQSKNPSRALLIMDETEDGCDSVEPLEESIGIMSPCPISPHTERKPPKTSPRSKLQS